MAKKASYYDSVDYSLADPVKILAQIEGRKTSKNLPSGIKEVKSTRGESAYVFNMGDVYGALVQEGLGTKSLITQSIYTETGKSYFAAIAQDTVAAVINDLVSVGATPVAINAYWSSSSYKWLSDKKVAKDLIEGWRTACDKAGVAWGGGETQSLKGIITQGSLELAGSAFGIIKPKKRLVNENNIKAGDVILLLESSGVHANGISLMRQLALKLKDGYQTELSDGSIFGEAILTPSHIYARTINDYFNQGIKIHYISNITRHGWRKIMRATPSFTYFLDKIPEVPEIFKFIAEQTGSDDYEMYGNYNMGAGYAVYLSPESAMKALHIAKKSGLNSWIAGVVKEGPKQVIVQPKNLIFKAGSLEIR